MAQYLEQTYVMRYVDGSAMLRHSFIKAAFLPAWRSILEADEEKDVFRRLEDNLNRVAKGSGLLELTIPMACVEAERIE